MDKKAIENNSNEYKKVAKTLLEIRPICHTISAVTTVLFILVFALARKESEVVINFLGWWSYLIAGIIAVLAALWYEDKVEKVIDSLGIVVSKAHSKRLVAALFIIAAPLIFLAGSTSFVGSSEMAASSADKIFEQEVSEVQKRIEDNSKLISQDRQKREKELSESRAQLRETIQKEFEIKLKKVPISNKEKFHDFEVSEWHFNKLQEHNQKDSMRLLESLAKALSKHDSETDKMTRELIQTHTQNESDDKADNKALFEFNKSRTERKVSRLDWFGNFFGIIAVIALLISVVASMGAHWICEALKINPKQLRKKRAVFSSFSPTLLKRSKKRASESKNEHKTKKEHTSRGVGEGFEHEIQRLKSLAKQLVKQRLSENPQVRKQATEELIIVVDQLEELGVEMYWQNEAQTEINFKEI